MRKVRDWNSDKNSSHVNTSFNLKDNYICPTCLMLKTFYEMMIVVGGWLL